MSVMLVMVLLWIVPAGVVVLADLPILPVDPQPQREMRTYGYNPRLPNLRWDLDGRPSRGRHT